MAEWFPAIRATLDRYLGPHLPPRPFRVLAGAALMAVLAWGVWQGGALLGRGVAVAWERAVLWSGLTQAALSDLGQRLSARTAPAREAGTPVLNSTRGSINHWALPFVETGPVPLDGAIRRVDYALVQAVRRLGLEGARLELIQSSMAERKTKTGRESYPVQRIRARVPVPAREFAASVSAALTARAEGATAVLSGKGRPVLRIRTAKTLTHELFIIPGGRVFVPPPRADRPRLTVVIDDLGADLAVVRRLLALDVSLTLSVMPDTPHAVEASRLINASGQEVLLHQPMEPRRESRADPGPAAIRLSMSAEAMRAALRAALAKVPEAAGMSNHMGSGVTGDPAACLILADEAAKNGLFVLDSVTHPASVLHASARSIGLTSWRRDVFLDDGAPDTETVLANLRQAEARAGRVGHTIAIGHPHPATLRALEQWAATRNASEVAVVPLRYQPR